LLCLYGWLWQQLWRRVGLTCRERTMFDWPVIIVGATLFVAYANGANDNFKGVATLFGSGTTDYRKALGWPTLPMAALLSGVIYTLRRSF
jgi:hypothetical protein